MISAILIVRASLTGMIVRISSIPCFRDIYLKKLTSVCHCCGCWSCCNIGIGRRLLLIMTCERGLRYPSSQCHLVYYIVPFKLCQRTQVEDLFVNASPNPCGWLMASARERKPFDSIVRIAVSTTDNSRYERQVRLNLGTIGAGTESEH